jgi:hypothetical protein
VNVEERIGALSLHLGAAGPAVTFWHLSASGPLKVLDAQHVHVRFGQSHERDGPDAIGL